MFHALTLSIVTLLALITAVSAGANEPKPSSGFHFAPARYPTQSHYPDEFSPADRSASEIRRTLRRAGLSPQTVQSLERDGFPYPLLRQALEDAALRQGSGRNNAQRRAREIAQRVRRWSQEGRQVSRSTDSELNDSSGWRHKQIREKLQQVGLPTPVLRALAREGFPLGELEEQIREWLLDTGYDAATAEERSRNLTNQIRDIKPAEPPALAERTTAAIREVLRTSGLSARQVNRLQQRDFPYDEVRILVEHSLEDRGYAASRARRQAREIARQVDQWREFNRSE